MMPIENVFGAMKDWLEEHAKPTTKQGIIDGVSRFVNEVLTRDYCTNFISHIFTSMDQVLARKGAPVRGKNDWTPDPDPESD